mgnify:CR=1 FL=1
MERVTNHERPGVYSAYTATAAAQRGNRRGVAAVVAVSQKGTAGTLYALGSYRQAAETFGAEDGLTALVKLLLANGAARVLAVPVADETGYAAAFALVQEQEGVNVVICDSEKLAVQQKRLDESEVDALIRGGVTPVERVGGSCWVIRGVTTRTKTGQARDQTWRDLTTILVVDDVIPGVREALRARFPRAKNTAQTRGAVQSLVVEVLERKLAAEVITGYDAVEVTALADEPGICLVTFGFTVTHGMDQIWLSAEVTV